MVVIVRYLIDESMVVFWDRFMDVEVCLCFELLFYG